MRVDEAGPRGPIFSAAFSAAAISTAGARDIFHIHITAPSDSKVALREIRLSQYSDFGDAQAELLPLQLMVGTSSVSTGAALAPQNVQRHAGAPTAGTAVVGPSTALASTAAAAMILADAWNVQPGWWWSPPADQHIILSPGQRAVIRMGVPNDSITMNGTVIFQEIGHP